VFDVAGGGCLLVVGAIVVVALLVATQLRYRADRPTHGPSVISTARPIPSTRPTTPAQPTSVPIVVSNPTEPPAPTSEPPIAEEPTSEPPDASASFPAQLVGQWIYSDESSTWLYSFNSDGSYQRHFDGTIDSAGCVVKIERSEVGQATIDGSNLVLQIQSGEKTTTDSCDSSSNAIRDLAGTTDSLSIQAEMDGDRVVQLDVDRLPLRPYNPNA
jgi:hypothetical protein